MKNVIAFFSLFFLTASLAGNVGAQWSTIPSVDNNLNASKSSPAVNFASCTDGNGGAFYAFAKASLSDGNTDVFVNRIDKNGVVRWGTGKNLNGTADNQNNPVICEDGHGGCYVAYENLFSVPGYPVFVQHFDSSGNKLWTGNGLRAMTIDNSLGQSAASLANNNGNGVFVTVQNTAFGGADGIQSQKLSFTGTKQWGAAGHRVIIPGYERSPETVTDGNGGLMIIWFSAYQLRAQHLNGSGTRLYDTANYFLNTAPIGNGYKLIRDSANRFIAVWPGDHGDGTSFNIYAQKIAIGGAKLWGATEVTICDTTGIQSAPDVLSDNNGGAYISWYDNRAADAGFYAQRINNNGVRQWQKQGVPLYTAGTNYTQNCMVPDLNNAVKVFFRGLDGNYAIRMQSLNFNGTLNAAAQGIAVSSANSPYLPLKGGVVSLPGGEAIVFAEIYAGNYNEMYAKKVPQGCIATAPAITKVTLTCGPNSATITWPGHLFSTYELRYKIASAGAWTTIGNVGRVTTYTFTNLQPNTAYKFQLRAICDIGNSASPWANRDKTTQNCLINANEITDAENIAINQTGVLNIYPNPVHTNCVIKLNMVGNGILKVFDGSGNIKYQVSVTANQWQIALDLSSFVAGTYICRVEISGKIFTQKLIVVK